MGTPSLFAFLLLDDRLRTQSEQTAKLSNLLVDCRYGL